MLMLAWVLAFERSRMLPDQPHPSPDRPPLEGQVLWVFKNEVGEVKDRSKPVVLVYRKVV